MRFTVSLISDKCSCAIFLARTVQNERKRLVLDGKNRPLDLTKGDE